MWREGEVKRVQREQCVRCAGNGSDFVLQPSLCVLFLRETQLRPAELWGCPQAKEEPKQGTLDRGSRPRWRCGQSPGEGLGAAGGQWGIKQ